MVYGRPGQAVSRGLTGRMAGGFPQRGCLCRLSCPQRNLGDRPKLLPIQNCPSGFCSTTGLRETPNLVGPFCGAGAKGGFRVPVMVPARLHPGLLPHSHLSSAPPCLSPNLPSRASVGKPSHGYHLGAAWWELVLGCSQLALPWLQVGSAPVWQAASTGQQCCSAGGPVAAIFIW